MSRSIVGLFPDRSSAEAAIRDLKAAGFNPDRIGIVMRDRREAREAANDQGVNSTAGAVTGGVIGGTAGALLAATGALAVPGVGPFITGGILASLVGGTAGWLVGGLAGMGVPREEAEYSQGRVEQGNVLVTVDAQGRDDEARQIMLRNGAEGARAPGMGAMPAARPTLFPTGTTGSYAADRANLGASAQDANPGDGATYAPPTTQVPPDHSAGYQGDRSGVVLTPGEPTRRDDSGDAGRVGQQPPMMGQTSDQARAQASDRGDAPAYGPTLAADPQQYPPASTGIAPGTMANQRGTDQGLVGAAGAQTSVGSQLGGVQPSAVSDQVGDRPGVVPRDDLLHQTPGTGDTYGASMSAQERSPYSDPVTSAGAQEWADYNRGTRRDADDRPVTDADIIADAEGQRRRTEADLDVEPAADQPDPDQRGLF